MNTVIIIGAGGVGRVVAHKCASVPHVFHKIVLASRTISKCKAIASEIKNSTIHVEQVDADHPEQLQKLMQKYHPNLVINVALPYQDLSIMDACLEGNSHYIDTASYEPKDSAHFEYKQQWSYKSKFAEKNLMCLLGSGFDPGVTNVFCAHSLKHHFEEIETIDIFDCNDGDHGKNFATNFNPEINIREIIQKGRYWEDGEWIETEPFSVCLDWDYPTIGKRKSYLLYHEELESLVKNIPKLRRIRFFMTFGEEYLLHLRVLQNIGMTGIHPIDFQGQKIIPLEFLKALLPDPSHLAENYTGKTCIGAVIKGKKNGKDEQLYIYNICSHQEAYKETFSQAVSYTTGVPCMIGAMLILSNVWKKSGVYNIEEMDPDPFMQELQNHGLPWVETWL